MVIPRHITSWFNQARRFGPPRRLPNMSESSLARWAAVSGFAVALRRRPIRLAEVVLTTHPPNWFQTNLATKQDTKPVAWSYWIMHSLKVFHLHTLLLSVIWSIYHCLYATKSYASCRNHRQNSVYDEDRNSGRDFRTRFGLERTKSTEVKIDNFL